MSKKTINQALKDLFLGLGGDSKALEDNSGVGDYIEDLESAIKSTASGASEDLIDDTTASETKVYSSSKVESLIPSPELPTVTSSDLDKQLSVIRKGPNYTWGISSNPIPSWKNGYCGLFNISNDKSTITPEAGYGWDSVFYNIDNKNVYNPIIVCIIWNGVSYMGEIVGYDQSKGYLWLFKCWNSTSSSFDEHILACSRSGSTYTATFI